MAIGATHKQTSVDLTDLSSYTTGSITSANNDILLCFVTATSAATHVPTLTSTHGSWQCHYQVDVSPPYGQVMLYAFSCLANGNTGAITITFDATMLRCVWSVAAYSGCNPVDWIAQITSASGQSTSPLVTLSAFESASNATVGGVLGRTGLTTVTPGSGFTELGETSGANSEALEQEWRSGNDTTVDATLSQSSEWTIIGIELRDASVEAPQYGMMIVSD